MSIHSVCKKCGNETVDYCCAVCNSNKIEELEATVERLTLENTQLKGHIADLENRIKHSLVILSPNT